MAPSQATQSVPSPSDSENGNVITTTTTISRKGYAYVQVMKNCEVVHEYPQTVDTKYHKYGCNWFVKPGHGPTLDMFAQPSMEFVDSKITDAVNSLTDQLSRTDISDEQKVSIKPQLREAQVQLEKALEQRPASGYYNGRRKATNVTYKTPITNFHDKVMSWCTEEMFKKKPWLLLPQFFLNDDEIDEGYKMEAVYKDLLDPAAGSLKVFKRKLINFLSLVSEHCMCNTV
jgi:hypothetical protein